MYSLLLAVSLSSPPNAAFMQPAVPVVVVQSAGCSGSGVRQSIRVRERVRLFTGERFRLFKRFRGCGG